MTGDYTVITTTSNRIDSTRGVGVAKFVGGSPRLGIFGLASIVGIFGSTYNGFRFSFRVNRTRTLGIVDGVGNGSNTNHLLIHITYTVNTSSNGFSSGRGTIYHLVYLRLNLPPTSFRLWKARAIRIARLNFPPLAVTMFITLTLNTVVLSVFARHNSRPVDLTGTST